MYDDTRLSVSRHRQLMAMRLRHETECGRYYAGAQARALLAPKGHMGRDRQGNGEALADDRRKAGGDAHHPEPVAAQLSGLAGWPLVGGNAVKSTLIPVRPDLLSSSVCNLLLRAVQIL